MKKIFILLLVSALFAQNEETSKKTYNVSLVATSNVFAEYYDCGCPKAPLGGLARKAFFFKNMMSGREPLLIDAGNTFFSHGVINPDGLRVDSKKYKARNFVSALELIGYEVINIGSNDFKLGEGGPAKEASLLSDLSTGIEKIHFENIIINFNIGKK